MPPAVALFRFIVPVWTVEADSEMRADLKTFQNFHSVLFIFFSPIVVGSLLMQLFVIQMWF